MGILSRIFWQKLREINGFTKEVSKEVISRKILWWEIISRFSTLCCGTPRFPNHFRPRTPDVFDAKWMDTLFLRIFPFQCSNTAPRGGMQYSTFMPSPVAPPQVPNTTIPNMGMGTVPSSGANTGVNNTHYSSTFVSLPMSSRNQVSWPALRGLYFSISLRFSPLTFYIGKFITVSCLGFFLSWVPSI